MRLAKGAYPAFVPPFGPFRVNRASIQAKGLLAWWPFVITRGTNTILEVAGVGGEGDTWEGDPTWSDGYILEFDGTGDNVEFGDVCDFDGSTPFSLSVWFRTSTSAFQALFTKLNNGSAAGYAMDLDSTGAIIRFNIRNAANNRMLVKATNTCNDGQPHLATITYDGSKAVSGVNLYKDAILETISQSADTFTASSSNSTPLRVSGVGDDSTLFTGGIWDCRVYNKELSVAEIWHQWAPTTRYDLYMPTVPGRVYGVSAAVAHAARLVQSRRLVSKLQGLAG